MKSIFIEIVNVYSSGRITVAVKNSTGLPVKIWKESNSWGSARWRVIIIRNGNVETYFQNPDQVFTRNFPSYEGIEGRSQIEIKLDLNGGNWCFDDYCSLHDESGAGGGRIKFEARDLIFVVYDVPRSDEALRLGVWFGVVVAAALDMSKDGSIFLPY